MTRDPASTVSVGLADPCAGVLPHAPNAEGHMIEGCGHWTQQERPEAVNRILLEWLGRQR